jgi:hypothetical protein
VPGRLLLDIVRLLPSGEVTLEHETDKKRMRPQSDICRPPHALTLINVVLTAAITLRRSFSFYRRRSSVRRFGRHAKGACRRVCRCGR